MVWTVLASAIVGWGWQVPVVVPLGSHPYAVSSGSMKPTLTEGDVVAADRPENTCGTSTVTPGDMIIQDRDGVPWIRRVVAGPGQTVQMRAGVLFIDDVAVTQERVRTEPIGLPTPGLTKEILAETLPNGRAYEISDFGEGGMFDDTPRLTLRAGEWFGLGDERDNSIDSRFDGPVNHKDICGIIYAKQEAGRWESISAPVPTTIPATDQ